MPKASQNCFQTPQTPWKLLLLLLLILLLLLLLLLLLRLLPQTGDLEPYPGFQTCMGCSAAVRSHSLTGLIHENLHLPSNIVNLGVEFIELLHNCVEQGHRFTAWRCCGWRCCCCRCYRGCWS